MINMKDKDKQIRELEVIKSIWKTFAIIFIILSIAMVLGDTFIWNYGKLKQELQSCQDKVEVENETYDTLQICNPQDGCRNAIKCDWIDSLNLYRDCEVIE